jgi:isoleucyl-tRNA synthetase
LRYTLSEVAKILAPFTPFFAEDMYDRVKGTNSKVSVHLEDWSSVRETDKIGSVFDLMNETRRIVSFALEARARAGVKIRQPLRSISVKSEKLLGKDEYIALIRDEVNIKEVLFGSVEEEEVVLDTNITPELQAEGDARDLIRAIQEMRKEKDLSPGQSISVSLSTTSEGAKTLHMFEDEIKKVCFVKDFSMKTNEGQTDLWSEIEITF